MARSLQIDDERSAAPVWPVPEAGRVAGVGPEDLLRDLILGMRCGILSIDRAGRLVMLNALALQILELERPPRPGDPIERVLGDHPRLARLLRESFGMSSLPNRAEIDLRFRADKGKTIGFTLSLVTGKNGRPYGVAIFFKDLTQVEQKEEQERLKDRLAALGQMAASMAHEIRNPLASIEVCCSLLRRRLGADSATKELLDRINAEARRLNATITSSLEYVRPLKLNLEVGELRPLLDEALAVARERCGGAGIEFLDRFDAAVPAIPMDRCRLRQVFENLFLNALEAMDGRGVLSVETSLVRSSAAPGVSYPPGQQAAEIASAGSPLDSFVQVSVRDTGPGIAEEHQDKLFYPFFTTKNHGSGVGLPTAEKIVHSHRGILDFSSRPGQGAEFTVRLPLVHDAPEG